MKLTRHQKFIVWAENHKSVRGLWVWYVSRKDRKLAEQEFDKVVGSGLGTLRREDGSVVATPQGGRSTPKEPIVIALIKPRP